MDFGEKMLSSTCVLVVFRTMLEGLTSGDAGAGEKAGVCFSVAERSLGGKTT